MGNDFRFLVADLNWVGILPGLRAVGSLLFDRMMASTKVVGTAVFAIYVADAIGYTGSVGIQLYKDLAQGDMSRLGFFKGFTWFMTGLGTVCLVSSCIYFMRKSSPSQSVIQESASSGSPD